MRITTLPVLLFVLMFLTAPVHADRSEYKVQLIYAGDQSGSMRASHPSWMQAQRTFLGDYFREYQPRCQEIHLDYVGWGSEALPPLRTVLRTNADGEQLADVLSNLAYQNLKATVQHKGMLKALSLVTDEYDRSIIVFVSDEYVGGEKDAELWRLVPESVEVVGISLGSTSVSDYFKRHIVPPTSNGRHYHADTTTEFRTVLYDVFDEIGFDHCGAS